MYMRRFKVLFLYPNLPNNFMLPTAIAILSAILKRDDIDVKLFDTSYYDTTGNAGMDGDEIKQQILSVRPYKKSGMGLDIIKKDPVEDFVKIVNEYKPDLIAVSCTEDMFLLGVRLLKAVREHKILTVLGGVFATFSPELALKYDEIDLVCIGEGENFLPALCGKLLNGEDYFNIPGLSYRAKDGKIVKNGVSMVDMDSNPRMDLSIFDPRRFLKPMSGKIYRLFPVETFRGCSYQCTFCNSPAQQVLYQSQTGRSFFRRKSIKNIYEELKWLKNIMNAEYFYFWSDTFFSWPDREFEEWCDMYADIMIPFWIQTRPETINRKRLAMLKKINIHKMAVGLEHGNEKFRKEILRRNYSNKLIVEKTKLINEYGIIYSVNSIIGFPKETPELAMDTIELNRQIDAADRGVAFFSPFHGTPLRTMAEKLGYIEPSKITISLLSGSILNMPQFTKEQINGKIRTFNMYIKFPKERWGEIAKAEEITPEGDRIWNKLRNEFIRTYFNDNGSDGDDGTNRYCEEAFESNNDKRG